MLIKSYQAQQGVTLFFRDPYILIEKKGEKTFLIVKKILI
jgi:hypothetical protein